jgi:hypothetical protein
VALTLWAVARFGVSQQQRGAVVKSLYGMVQQVSSLSQSACGSTMGSWVSCYTVTC